MRTLKVWIEAMRLRTLPVGVAGVLGGVAYALLDGCFAWPQTLLCMAVAVLAQIASNFANEYFDFRAGLDAPGRVGPRRGVTEGDITPRAMAVATAVTLALACTAGAFLSLWGGWIVWVVGIAVALGVVAYSAGPWPLSRHGMGEIAVIFFFGIVPVNLTFWLQSGWWSLTVLLGSVGLGLMGANVLIVNNYRDMEDDAAVGKHTLAVIWGRRAMGRIYLLNGYLGVALMVASWALLPWWAWLAPAAYLLLHTRLYWHLTTPGLDRRCMNPMLGQTAIALLGYTLLFLLASAIA